MDRGSNHVEDARYQGPIFLSMTFRVFSKFLAAGFAVFALFTPAQGLPVAAIADDTRCSGHELAVHPAHLHDLHSISKRLHERGTVSASEVRMWLAARSQLKGELRTPRCMEGHNEQFCCQVCRAGQRSLLCSYSSLVRESKETLLESIAKISTPASGMKNIFPVTDDHAKDGESISRVATADGESNPHTLLHFARHTILVLYWITLGLFAVTCDKRVRNELYSSPSVLHFVLCASFCVVFNMVN